MYTTPRNIPSKKLAKNDSSYYILREFQISLKGENSLPISSCAINFILVIGSRLKCQKSLISCFASETLLDKF